MRARAFPAVRLVSQVPRGIHAFGPEPRPSAPRRGRLRRRPHAPDPPPPWRDRPRPGGTHAGSFDWRRWLGPRGTPRLAARAESRRHLELARGRALLRHRLREFPGLHGVHCAAAPFPGPAARRRAARRHAPRVPRLGALEARSSVGREERQRIPPFLGARADPGDASLRASPEQGGGRGRPAGPGFPRRAIGVSGAARDSRVRARATTLGPAARALAAAAACPGSAPAVAGPPATRRHAPRAPDGNARARLPAQFPVREEPKKSPATPVAGPSHLPGFARRRAFGNRARPCARSRVLARPPRLPAVPDGSGSTRPSLGYPLPRQQAATPFTHTNSARGGRLSTPSGRWAGTGR